MNLDNNEHNIDWDKLLQQLEDGRPSSGLEPEELAALAAAREMQARLKAGSFPAEEGWQRFTEARDQRSGRIRLLIKTAVAATVVLAAGAAWWTFRPKQAPMQIADALPEEKVKLHLSGGRTVTLGLDTQLIQNNTVARIQANTDHLEYAAGSASETVTAMDTLDVPRGRRFSLRLSDGTRVWLNADSRLIFPAAFHGASREVTVKGEAFFDVAQQATQPFIVHAGGTSMKVLGTSFNVNAYGPDMTATLSSGKLQVTAGAQQVVLLPDEQAVLHQDGALKKQPAEARTYAAWKDGDIFYEDAALENITTGLGRNYDYDFVFDDAGLKKMNFTIDIHQPATLQDVLNQIMKTLPAVRFEVKDRTVHVKRQS
ncbi:FecR family protein [Chitinophaga qingshengii]|uniref:FecR domain-containing protein n=1 Tax=Chitinophaga qingshengii TaxID=1569794 RepID=A0ABR7TQR5_9BACT|nr:FecR family protein [Chitinophaga qingshengii]MBC9932827.1 FecR domain-containing protein [Chitinophaga qingshengii]